MTKEIKQDPSHLTVSITYVDKAIESLKKLYEEKPENPISSVLIQLELVRMNLVNQS